MEKLEVILDLIKTYNIYFYPAQDDGKFKCWRAFGTIKIKKDNVEVSLNIKAEGATFLEVLEKAYMVIQNNK